MNLYFFSIFRIFQIIRNGDIMRGVQMWAATHGLYQLLTSLTENDEEHVF